MHSGREAGDEYFVKGKRQRRVPSFTCWTGTLASFAALNLASSDTRLTTTRGGCSSETTLLVRSALLFAFIFAGSSAAFTAAATFGIFGVFVTGGFIFWYFADGHTPGVTPSSRSRYTGGGLALFKLLRSVCGGTWRERNVV